MSPSVKRCPSLRLMATVSSRRQNSTKPGPSTRKATRWKPAVGRVPRGTRPTAGFHRVAFRVDGPGFVEFCRRLETVAINRNDGQRLTLGDIVDHDQSWSLYFVDPWGHRLEVTTYD